MTAFNYEIDLVKAKASPAEVEHIEKNGQGFLFEGILNSCINKKYRDGVQGPTLRALNSIYQKLDVDKTGTIDLESAELDLLKDIFMISEIAVLPQHVRLYSIYRDKVEQTVLTKP